ncbi:hypothetical protein K503DRAFT_794987 [Rhizopogon vinicolor AM-OR11-026]|uniref:Uncharacterized protein n=1 Tax=Rhizopogon vinicolor AM-OR11-026 TaxID=1314800 RepID=A0A1B7MEJ3_9AGAM|nr:hypothetical protein K503DRAFT_794987 [Rhizopogon vinicolor AM-OR11-026]
MHAYGHEWACQLEHNPRMSIGLGLSDGEGTERLWSWFVRLIGVERSSSRQRWLWLIDRQATAVGSEMWEDLDEWIKQHLKQGVKDQGLAALDVLNHCDISALESLERGHDRLMTKVEALYASLNVHDRFPELDGVNLDFIRVLLMACDLKMNIQKRAIASLFEWDKLDRAVGGSQQALGTKLYQHTRKAIAKHQPALMTMIRKFNLYCERLESLYDPAWNIPLPTPLPMKLVKLRGDQTLMQDVWVTPSIGEVPQWLGDLDIREGIQALLKHDRCREEQMRLGMEADNLCHFFEEELAALELSLRLPENEPFFAQWSNSLASSVCFASHAKEALELAIACSGGPQSTTLQSVGVTIQEPVAEDEANELDDSLEAEIVLADILESGDTDEVELDQDQDQGLPVAYNVHANIIWELPTVH